MDPDRVALVNKMVGLVNQLYLLETCCPQLSCEPQKSAQTQKFGQSKRIGAPLQHNCAPRPHSCATQAAPRTQASKTSARAAASAPQDSKLPCFMMKCKPAKCKSNSDFEPLITWTPVLEIRKTTNPKNLEKQNDNPVTKYVFMEPPGCPYQPVWSTKDPMCEEHCGPPKGCPALGPPPGYNGAPVELCCPGGRGPPVDRWGQPHECKQTLDGRAICKPTHEAGPTDWCDPKTTPFRTCDTKQDEKRTLLNRRKVLNQRFNNICKDPEDSYPSTSLYKRPVYPKKEACNDGRCRCPNNPNRKKIVRSRDLKSICY